MNPQTRSIRIIIIFAAALMLAVFAYANTFSGEFQFDDDDSIAENPYVNGSIKQTAAGLLTANGLRPLTAVTFVLNYRWWGQDVRGYHIVNFLIHVLNGLLILYLVFITMNSPKLTASEHGRASETALIAGAVFLLHPIQTESVSYIVQRSESLASFFYLCSLISYIKAVNAARKTNSVLYYSVSVMSYTFGISSKEIAVTIPVIILLYDFYFLRDRPFLKRVAVPGVLISLSLIVAVVVFFVFRGNPYAGFSVQTAGPFEYLLTQFRVLVSYIRLIFLPINQTLDYDLKISKGFFEPGTALSFAFLLALLIAAIAGFKKWRVESFFVLWFFIILTPTSSFIPVLDPILEHRIYLAAAGFFIITANILSKALYRFGGFTYKAAISALALLILLLGTFTFQRNRVWETKLALWEDAAKKAPLKSRVHNNLGNSYLLVGRYFEAIGEYKKAVALNSRNIKAYYNLALSLERVGLVDQAEYYYDIFYKNSPDDYNDQKGIVLERLDDIRKGRNKK